MHGGFFEGIDWSRPWLAPFRVLAGEIIREPDWRSALNERAAAMELKNHRGLPIRFVPQSDLPPGTAYEAFISATGGVPTRSNLHDFFNALVWLTFPKIKVRLNALQAAEIEKNPAAPPGQERHGAVRGKLRDAATIFDENAALLVVREQTLIDAFREHQWQDMFITRRENFFRDCDVWLFGHALMEKLVHPYKAITAHAWPLIADNAFFGQSAAGRRVWLDGTVSEQLAAGFQTSCFTPLPVLGIPRWWDAQDAPYYADRAVFRPKRKLPGR